MNKNITFILNSNSNNISCLSTNELTSYILSEEEQQNIATLNSNTNSIISSLMLTAAIRAGSSLYTQPELNKLYVRKDNPSYSSTNVVSFIDFLNTQLVGNEIMSFTELSGAK
jgi:hypothetical protein